MSSPPHRTASNAVKFTSPEGRVQVGLTQVGAAAQVTVKDSGVGIDPDFLPSVFDRFRQEDTSYTRPFNGLLAKVTVPVTSQRWR